MLDTDLTPQSYSWKKQIYFKQKLESPMCQRSSLEWEIFIGEVLSISDYTNFSVFTPISLRFAKIIKLRWHQQNNFYEKNYVNFLSKFCYLFFFYTIFTKKIFGPKFFLKNFIDFKKMYIKKISTKQFFYTTFFG